MQKILAVIKYQKFLGNICFFEHTFHRKQSLGAPFASQFHVLLSRVPQTESLLEGYPELHGWPSLKFQCLQLIRPQAGQPVALWLRKARGQENGGRAQVIKSASYRSRSSIRLLLRIFKIYEAVFRLRIGRSMISSDNSRKYCLILLFA